MSRFWLSLLVVVLVAGCSNDPAVETTLPSPDELDPEGVVRALLADVKAGRFEHAATLTDTGQAALLTLAEGADASDVVESLADQGEAVAANFWSGFAQTIAPDDDPAAWEVEVGEETDAGGHTFVPVTVVAAEDDERTFFLRRDGGGALRIVWEFTFDPVEGRGHVVGQFLETGAIQDSERSFYTAPEVRTLVELAGLECRAVAGDLALTVPAREAEPSYFFRVGPR